MKNSFFENEAIDTALVGNAEVESAALSLKEELFCPQCKERAPLIERIVINKKLRPLIRLKCLCSATGNNDHIEMDLNDYIGFLSTQKCGRICFKHCDQAAFVFCRNCALCMCQICYSYHLAFGPSHETSFIQTPNDNESCISHPNQGLDLYCENCQENICIECGRNSHFNHQVIQLREYWQKAKKQLDIESIEELNHLFSQKLSLNEGRIQDLLNSIQEIIMKLERVKLKIENKAKKTSEANKAIASFVCLLFENFFRTEEMPNYSIIKSIERLKINDLVNKREGEDSFNLAFNQMDASIKLFKKSKRDFSSQCLVRLREPEAKAIDDKLSTKEGLFPVRQYLQPLTQQKQPVPLETYLEPDEHKRKELPSIEIEKKKSNIPSTNCWNKRNTFYTNESTTQSIKEERCERILKKEDILKSFDIYTNSNDERAHLNNDQFLNQKTARAKSKTSSEEVTTIKEDSLKKKLARAAIDKKKVQVNDNLTSSNEALIIKLPLDIIELDSPTLKQKEDGAKDNDIALRQEKKSQRSPHNHITSLENMRSNFNCDPLSARVFNNDYDGLTNILGDDNKSRLNFDLLIDKSNNPSRRESLDFTLDNETDIFNKIFSKPSQALSSPVNTMKLFDYSVIPSFPSNIYEKCSFTLSEHKNTINVLAQLRNGLLVSGGRDNVLNFYDSSNGFECVSKIPTNKSEIISFLELFNQTIALGCIDNSIKIHDLTTSKCTAVLIGHCQPVTSMAQKDNDHIVSASEDHTVKIWNLRTNQCLITFDEHYQSVTGVILLNEATFATSSSDSTIKLWSFTYSTSLHTIKAHRGPITTIIKLDDSLIASSSYDKTIKIWDVNLKICKATLIGHSDKVTSLTRLKDGTLASASFDCSIKLWDLDKMICKKSIISSSKKITNIIQLTNGSIASAADDDLIKIWE